MIAKRWQIHLRWKPSISRRRLRRLEAALPHDFQVGVDGLDGQSDKDPDDDELQAVLDAVRAARMRSDGLSGAIVPYGYKWKDGRGHGGDCGCRELAERGDVNTLACPVAEEHATSPPLVVWPSDAGVVP